MGMCAADFRVKVREGEGYCLAGEVYAQQVAEPTILILSFEGPRVRRELARPAANPADASRTVPRVRARRRDFLCTSFIPSAEPAVEG